MLNHITMFQPSAIDNAFSTLQIIHKLIKHMNEVIDEVNSIDSKANEYTDEQIRLVKNELNSRIDDVIISIGQLETDLKQFARDYTDTQIDDLKNEYIHNKLVEVYEAIEVVNDRLTTLYERLDIKIDRTKNELAYLIEVTKAELIELIKKGGSVYSGVTGELTNSEKAIKQLVDKVQHKNGVEWYDIITQISSQVTGTDTELTDVIDSNLKIKFPVNEICDQASTYSYYFSDYMFGYGVNNSSSEYYHLSRTFNITLPTQYILHFMKINGITVYNSMYSITTSPSGVIPIPFLIRATVNDEWQAGFASYNGYNTSTVPLKRINHIEIHTSAGVINFIFEIPFLTFKLPSYNDIISSCSTNKKWNTWDTLTYYTTKFLNEHCDNGSYTIPFSDENEILFNNSGDLKGFYDNKS